MSSKHFRLTQYADLYIRDIFFLTRVPLVRGSASVQCFAGLRAHLQLPSGTRFLLEPRGFPMKSRIVTGPRILRSVKNLLKRFEVSTGGSCDEVRSFHHCPYLSKFWIPYRLSNGQFCAEDLWMPHCVCGQRSAWGSTTPRPEEWLCWHLVLVRP